MQTGTGKAKDSLVVLRCQGRHESIDPLVLSSLSLSFSLSSHPSKGSSLFVHSHLCIT